MVAPQMPADTRILYGLIKYLSIPLARRKSANIMFPTTRFQVTQRLLAPPCNHPRMWISVSVEASRMEPPRIQRSYLSSAIFCACRPAHRLWLATSRPSKRNGRKERRKALPVDCRVDHSVASINSSSTVCKHSAGAAAHMPC